MKKILTVLMLLFVAVSANCQLLWRVSGNNCYESSYLFGTLHLETANFIDSVPGLNEAINIVDVIYGEIGKGELTSTTTMMQLAKEATAPADSTIDKLLNKNDYNLVDSVIKSYMFGFGLKELKLLKPAVITAQLNIMQMQKYFPANLDPNNMLDMAIQRRGEALGKHVDGLETVDAQTKALFGASLIEQAEELVDFCRKDREFDSYSYKLCNAYRAQDLDAIEAIVFNTDYGMDENDMERLSYERNRNWMDRITSTLPVQRALIAVGAAHLVGKDGLINLLRNQGYTVEPVTSANQ